MTPSASPKIDQVSQLLKENAFRTQFTRTLDKCRKYHDKLALSSFLSKCVDLEIIPATFIIRNSPHEHSSESQKSRWSLGAKTASLEWLKSTVCELELKIQFLLEEYRSNLNLLLLPLSDSDRPIVQQLFLEKSVHYENLFKEVRNKKLCFLKDKYGSDPLVLNKKRNRPGQQTRARAKKQRKREKKTPISVVFNYSSFELTETMLSLLNRGLNFVVKPLNLNISKVLTDFKSFERKMVWAEFFHGSDNSDYKPPLFKTEKTNMPRNYSVPKGLQKFHNTVEFNLQDKSKFNKTHLDPKNSNISSDKISALKTLIDLQRNR